MHIEPIFRPIHDVLKIGFFFVPRFQRPYSWEEQHIEEFWRDCVEDATDAEYFIGSLVLYKEGGKYGIVDGQQRLTTVTMILCALRDEFSDRGLSDLAKGLSQLVVRPNIDNKMEAVLASESSIPYFQAAIQRLPGTHTERAMAIEEKRLESSFAFIKKKLGSLLGEKKRAQAEKTLKSIRDRVLGLKTVALVLDNDVDAYMIFETLNTRGKDLELGDLIRTHLAKCLPQGNATTDPVRSKFDDLRKEFERAGRKLDDFILHFWLSRYNYTAKRKIYKNLKSEVKQDKAREFFDEFLRDGDLYLDLMAPKRREWKREEIGLSESLAALRLFRVEQPNPFVLAVCRAYIRGHAKLKMVRRAIAAVENFHFAFTAITSSRSSGGISQMYASHARAIAMRSSSQEIADEIDNLVKKLIERRPSRDEFIGEFVKLGASEKISRQKQLVQYILHKIANTEQGNALDKSRMTIEHLASQSGQGHTLDSDTVAKIGNLAWVTDEAQKKLGTKKIDRKVAILGECGLWIDDFLQNHVGEWNKRAIIGRSRAMAELAYDNVWTIR